LFGRFDDRRSVAASDDVADIAQDLFASHHMTRLVTAVPAPGKRGEGDPFCERVHGAPPFWCFYTLLTS
jgi:hypothetical protein